LLFGAAIFHKLADFFAGNAAIAWGVQVGAGGGQKQPVAAAENAVTRIVEEQQVIRGAIVKKSRHVIAHRHKVVVDAELDVVKVAARAILKDATQCNHVVGRRIEPRQALIRKIRHPD